MINKFIKKLFTKRSILGTILLMVLIGEPTAGGKTGLFTPQGFFLFFLLYLSLFHLFEVLIVNYHLVVFQVVLLTFAIYSVVVTGLLNKELTEYVLQPNPFITLIRIQASFFVAFAFYLLNRIVPRHEEMILSFKQALGFFVFVILLASTSGTWGIPAVIITLKTVPLLAFLFIGLGILALYFALKTRPNPTYYSGKKYIILAIFYLILGLIPNTVVFIVLLISMIGGGVYILWNRNIRNSLL